MHALLSEGKPDKLSRNAISKYVLKAVKLFLLLAPVTLPWEIINKQKLAQIYVERYSP